MKPVPRWVPRFVTVLLVVGAVASVGAAGVASAGHDPADANATMKPFDRTPGATGVKYGQTVVSTAGVDLETLTRTLGVYEAGSFANCGGSPPDVFGVDRGNDQPGYEVDEDLIDNVKSFSAGEDELETNFYREEDFGASTYLDDGDELVAVTDCIDNPDQPGWYRIRGVTEGENADGETVSYGGHSHYFWICNCENEAEAREQLGPPPSEAGSTPTPTASGSGGGGETTVTPGDGGGGGAAATPASSGNDEPTATRTRTPEPTPTPSPSATPPESWNSVVVRTPTPGSGAGFGGIVAFAALSAVALLFRRRI